MFDEPTITLLAALYAELDAYQQQAAIVEAQIAAGDDCEWNTKRLNGWRWNIQVTRNKIAREEQKATGA